MADWKIMDEKTAERIRKIDIAGTDEHIHMRLKKDVPNALLTRCLRLGGSDTLALGFDMAMESRKSFLHEKIKTPIQFYYAGILAAYFILPKQIEVVFHKNREECQEFFQRQEDKDASTYMGTEG